MSVGFSKSIISFVPNVDNVRASILQKAGHIVNCSKCHMWELIKTGAYKQVEVLGRWNPRHLLKCEISIDRTTYILFIYSHTYILAYKHLHTSCIFAYISGYIYKSHLFWAVFSDEAFFILHSYPVGRQICHYQYAEEMSLIIVHIPVRYQGMASVSLLTHSLSQLLTLRTNESSLQKADISGPGCLYPEDSHSLS